MFLVIYIDYFHLYQPGEIDLIRGGQIFEFDISGTLMSIFFTVIAISALMVLLSVALPARVSRVTNLVVASLYIPVMVFNAVGGDPGLRVLLRPHHRSRGADPGLHPALRLDMGSNPRRPGRPRDHRRSRVGLRVTHLLQREEGRSVDGLLRCSRSCEPCCMDLEVSPRLTIPASELQWRFSRSSGPGGQHVNTSDSRVQLTWNVADSPVVTDDQRTALLSRLGRRISGGAITVTVSAQRSQLRNRETALDRLAMLVRDALAPPAAIRRATRPTLGSARRHLAAKRQRSEIKQQRQRPPGD